MGNIALGDADTVRLEQLSGAVLVDGEVASLLHNGRILEGGFLDQRPDVDVDEEHTLTALSAEATCLLRANLNMAAV